MSRVDASTPQSVGPYRLVRLIGRGGMGEVYEGYDARLDRRVAIKRQRTDRGDDPAARARFRREARSAARLRHRAIVQVHDLVEDEAGDWIVMELVEGATLAERLQGGPLPVGEAVELGRQVAEALASAHALGIVHRDLKAENVMVDAAGARVLDFGLAKPFDRTDDDPSGSVTATGQVLGTPRAMSPEQARGYPLDARSDLFSLGVLLYEMLTGVSPFRGATGADTVSRLLTHTPSPARELAPAVPEPLSALVEALLAKSPEHRPADAAAVARELAALATGTVAPPAIAGAEETLAATAAVSHSEPRASTRRRLRLAIGAAIVLAVVIVFASRMGPAAPRAATAHALFVEGMGHLDRYNHPGEIDAAIAAFQRAIARRPDSASAYAGLARAYWRQYAHASRDPQWLTQAEAAAARAVELDGDLALARVSRGLVSTEQGRLDEATADFEAAIALEPSSADPYLGLAGVALARGDLTGAESAYAAAIERRPEDRAAHDGLGTVFFRTGRLADAEAAFRRSVELDPEGTLGRRNLSAVYYQQGRYAEAATEVQRALEIAPSPSLYSNLGAIFFAQGLYERAVDAFEKALEGGGFAANDSVLWANLADAYRWTPDNGDKARDAYLRAIQLVRKRIAEKPLEPQLRTRLALYLAKRGDCEEALAEIAVMPPVPERDGYGFYRLAVGLEVCGRRDPALAELRRALAGGLPVADLESDPELRALRADRRYHELVMAAAAS